MEEDLLAKLVDRMRAIGNDTQNIEVKAAAGGMPTTIAESISALSNGSGGTIILGLVEKEGFAPATGFRARAMFDGLSTICADKLTPPVRANISIQPFEGAEVVVAEVPETMPSSKPCFITSRGMYNGSFIRTGDGDRTLTQYEIDRLMEERIQPQHDLELVEKSSVDDLDKDLVEAVLETQRKTHPRVFGKLGRDEALEALNITAKDAEGETRLTLAGLVALGVYPQHYFPCLTIDFACYAGLTKAGSGGIKLLDTETLIGPIPYMLVDAMRAVRRNMRQVDRSEGELDWPEDVVREAICNALVHRDYSYLGRGSAVQVDLYPDRLEILSPGGLYGSVTVDRIAEVGESSHRNQCLAKLLETVPYEEGGCVVLNRGNGFSFIEEELAECGMPAPIVVSTPSRFRLVMYRRGMGPGRGSAAGGARECFVDRANRQSPMEAVTELTDSQQQIYYALVNLEQAKTGEVMEATGYSRVTVVKGLKKLTELGLVEVENRGDSKNSPQRCYRLPNAG